MWGINRISCILLLLAFALVVNGRENTPGQEFYYQQLDNRNGLSNSAVNAVFQDRDQLIWVGTWDGLNMYDGTDFKVFNYSNDNNSESIGNNVVQDIKEDLRGNVWVSTIGGITRFEKSTGKFFRYFYNQATKSSIAEKEYELIIDSRGSVFCYGKSIGLTAFNEKNSSFESIGNTAEYQKGIVKIEAGPSGKLWLLRSDGSLVILEDQNGNLTKIREFDSTKGFSNLFVCNGRVLVQSRKGSLLAVDKNYSLKPLSDNFPGIKSLEFYRNHFIIAWQGQGIAAFDVQMKPSSLLAKEVRQLASTKVTALFSARNDVLWVVTDGNGVIKIHPKLNHFGLVNMVRGISLDRPVRTFA